jgi:hypothetical protein
MTIAFAILIVTPSDFHASISYAERDHVPYSELVHILLVISTLGACVVSTMGVMNVAQYVEMAGMIPASCYSDWVDRITKWERKEQRNGDVETQKGKISPYLWFHTAVTWLFLSMACLCYMLHGPVMAIVAWVFVVFMDYTNAEDNLIRTEVSKPDGAPLSSKQTETEQKEQAMAPTSTNADDNFTAKLLRKVSTDQVNMQQKYLGKFKQGGVDLVDFFEVDDSFAGSILTTLEIPPGHQLKIISCIRKIQAKGWDMVFNDGRKGGKQKAKPGKTKRAMKRARENVRETTPASIPSKLRAIRVPLLLLLRCMLHVACGVRHAACAASCECCALSRGALCNVC